MFRHLFRCGMILAALFISSALSQTIDSIPAKRAMITQAVNSQQRVALPGNTRSAANASNDRGRVLDGLPLEHMLLQLQRPPELAEALDQFTKNVQNPASPNYHQWLTAAQFGQKFGLAQSDIDAVANWLESQGFRVNQVYLNMMTVDFSGTAGQVRQAFGTEIHNLQVNGENHIANMSDPQIPAALAPAVVGLASLNDFTPRPMIKRRPTAAYTEGGGIYAVVPADLATIYNLNPLFSKGITGKGQTIVVIEDTNVYSTTDWTTFRGKFGLSAYTSGSFTQVHPGNCSNPGVNSDDNEAILDAEWATAAAPNAAIQLASCGNTATTFGGLIALQNLLNASGTPPALVSISYGECEVENGAGANAAYSSAFQQAVTEGVSVFVSSGDEGAASCDAGANYAIHGVGVSGFASTPYNVAVGGTDFGDTYAGTTSTYWNTTNTAAFGSAKSYIPEIPWNDSCASGLIANYLGYAQSWGAAGFCNSITGQTEFINVAAGSGGPSGCAAALLPPELSAEAAADTRSPPGKRDFSAIQTTGFVTSRMSPYLPPTVSGAITLCFASPTRQMAERRVRARPALGPGRAERRSPRPSWPAYRRSSIRIRAAAGAIRTPTIMHSPPLSMERPAPPLAIQTAHPLARVPSTT